MTPLLRSAGGVTLIGGGAVTGGELAEALALAPQLVAADGGGDAALALGHRPDLVIGDMDSLSADGRARIGADRVHHIAEQVSTDFEKCLMRIEARFVIAVGFAGRRLDHTLAALNSMVRRPRPQVVMIAAEDIVFLCPPRLELPTPAGTRVSLFPMGPAQGTSTGLEWPIDGIAFAPGGPGGTSNRANGPVSLTMKGNMLVMLPRDHLGLALAALTGD